MKRLSEYFVKKFINIIEGSSLYKDNIEKMLLNMEMNDLRDINQYLKETDASKYMPYETNNDDFLNKDNKVAIIKRISDFLLKYKI